MNYFLVVFIFFSLLFDKLNIFFYMLASSVLHETGHIAACLLCGYKPKLKVSVFGISLRNYPEEKNKKIFVLISGPIINLIFILSAYYNLENNFTINAYIFCIVNVVIFCFNILPFEFLDGGQLVRLFISDYKAIKVMDTVSIIVLVLFVMYFSNNITNSLLGILLFSSYYIFNKINLRL